jgi:hypothetical protein
MAGGWGFSMVDQVNAKKQYRMCLFSHRLCAASTIRAAELTDCRTGPDRWFKLK